MNHNTINEDTHDNTDFDKFHPLIIRNNDSFCVYLPEWKVSGTGRSLDAAYLQFMNNMKAVANQNETFGLSALTPDPYPTLTKRAVIHDLSLFLVKIAASALILIFLIVILLPNLSASFHHAIKGVIKDPKYWALDFPAKVNARLDSITPELEEKMIRDWKTLIERIAPIFTSILAPQNGAIIQREPVADSQHQ